MGSLKTKSAAGGRNLFTESGPPGSALERAEERLKKFFISKSASLIG